VDGRVGLTPEQTQGIPRGCGRNRSCSVKSSVCINTQQQLAYYIFSIPCIITGFFFSTINQQMQAIVIDLQYYFLNTTLLHVSDLAGPSSGRTSIVVAQNNYLTIF
jgi:hypothetical protein